MTTILDEDDWRDDLADHASTEAFERAASQFDGSVAFEVGDETAWFKVYRGRVIDTEPYVPAFGATFRVVGDRGAWRRVASGETSLSGAIHVAELRTVGDKLEANRMREMLELLVRSLQDLEAAHE
ncbi:hypothetical protein ACFPYI_19620 [Halomarina salina]|uniref:SCP2 domain-containing protein n=1 Tax=Halomarina salina TaxID=1872699 RepID=A0ABD5RTA1_9EURY|nr:hypothetical protein [Halomarina salina]